MQRLVFSKSWTRKSDFPTYEDSEEQVRQDMQLLHDEARDALNAALDRLESSAGAEEIGARSPGGMQGENVQALINELAAAISSLAGNIALDGGTLAQLVAAALEGDVLGGYYSKEQVNELIAALGVSSLSGRVTSIENAIAADGVVAGEIVREYPFTAMCAPLRGAEAVLGTSTSNRVFINGRLWGLTFGDGGVQLKSVDVLSAKYFAVTLTGEVMSATAAASVSYSVLWLDAAGEYMIVKAGTEYYLISLVSGASARLCAGSNYGYRGCARLGGVICAVFYEGGYIYFERRDVGSDAAGAPLITKLTRSYETGSVYDAVLNVYGEQLFVMLKYGADESKLKVYAPDIMSASSEFATGLAGAYAQGSVRLSGGDCYFIISTAPGYRPAKCTLTTSGSSAVPVLTVGGESIGGASIAAGDGSSVYCVYGKTLYRLGADSMDIEETLQLPEELSTELCFFNGAPLGELWGGGKYLPAGRCIVNVSDMSSRRICCAGDAAPESYALQPAPERYFVVKSGGEWHLFDCLLRAVWGMVPYTPSSQRAAARGVSAVLDTSGFTPVCTVE